jgi:alpha-L-fucosidase
MKVNGESIYGTTASPLKTQPVWGRVTKKGDKLYRHIFDWPKDGSLQIEGLKSPIKKAYSLADTNKPLPIGAGIDGLVRWYKPSITLPPKPLDPIDSVVVLQQ